MRSADIVVMESRFRWVMLALVWMAYACFGMTIWSLAPLVKTITRALDINSSQMGLVLGGWQLMYIPVALFMGVLVDRIGVRRTMTIGIGIIAISLGLRAIAVDFFTLFIVVALFGLGGPIVSVGAPKVVSLWFTGKERGIAAGLYSTAPVVGGIIVLITANSIVVPLTGHWRLAFVTYGVVALAATMAWWLLARDKTILEPHSSEDGERLLDMRSETAISRHILAGLLRERNVRLVLLLSFACFFLNHGLNNWLPTILQDKGMSPDGAGFWASIPSFASIAGLIIIPMVTRYGYRAWAIAMLFAWSAGSIAGIAFIDGGVLLGVVLVVSGFSRSPLMPMLILVLMDTHAVGHRRMGIASGMFFTIAEIGGFSGPFLMGVIRDLNGTLFSGLLLLSIMAAVFGVCALLISERRIRP